MSRYAQGIFRPKNMHKYVGKGFPRYRSSWEAHFFRFLDEHQNVLQWASEALRIPYRHPITGKMTTYVPDILMQYVDQKNMMHVDLIEIKPSSQTSLQEASSNADKLHAIVNGAKWEAARAYCKAQGIVFRVVSEKDLFKNSKPSRPRRKTNAVRKK